MIVVWNAEFAQSYIAQARSSRRPSPRRSSSAHQNVLPRDPLAQQRVDDDVAVAFAGEDVFAHERGERCLHRRRAAQPVSRAGLGRQQLAAVLQHRGAQRGALRQGQPLPGRLEQRLVLAEQPRQRRVQILEADRPPSVRPRIVPELVREPLHVVGQVAGELDDRLAEAGARS